MKPKNTRIPVLTIPQLRLLTASGNGNTLCRGCGRSEFESHQRDEDRDREKYRLAVKRVHCPAYCGRLNRPP